MQRLGRNAHHADTQPSVHKRLLQERALVERNATLAGLAVEENIDGDQGTAKDSGTIEELLDLLLSVWAHNNSWLGGEEAFTRKLTDYFRGGWWRGGGDAWRKVFSRGVGKVPGNERASCGGLREGADERPSQRGKENRMHDGRGMFAADLDSLRCMVAEVGVDKRWRSLR